jgi:hypothetical protein
MNSDNPQSAIRNPHSPDSSNRFLLRKVQTSDLYFADLEVTIAGKSAGQRQLIFTREQLLNFAAWAKVLADPLGWDFNRLVADIEKS